MALTPEQESLLADLQENVEVPVEAPVEAGQSRSAGLARLAAITAELGRLVDELARLNAEQSRVIAALEREGNHEPR